MKIIKMSIPSLVLTALLSTNSIAATKISTDARAFIISPAHGQVVSSPVTVIFGLSGAGVAPAGVDKKNTGHHHLIIDANTPNLKSAITKDDKHRHFGGGQTQTSIKLAPGKHTLQLVLGDKSHAPHSPPVVSKVIEITVKQDD